MKVLYAIYNISGYLLAELKELSKLAEVTVIETPCNIDKGSLENCVTWIDRRSITGDNIQKLLEIGFDLFVCPGWADALMLKLASELKRKGVRTVLSVDTPWKGSIKQLIHCVVSRFYLVPYFDFAWGAGEPQVKYLKMLGFANDRVYQGTYCADTEKFSKIGEDRLKKSSSNDGGKSVRVFLYIGRYVEVKNMRRMERAFIKALEYITKERGNKQVLQFKLRCIGNGKLWEERTIHPAIEHLGYKQPSEIQEYVKDADCFVLPSLYEPWGVVVHEAALMALPMICSNKIQAATRFLKSNGYQFDPLNEDDIALAFLKIMKLSEKELRDMGAISYQLGMGYTTRDWAARVRGMIA